MSAQILDPQHAFNWLNIKSTFDNYNVTILGPTIETPKDHVLFHSLLKAHCSGYGIPEQEIDAAAKALSVPGISWKTWTGLGSVIKGPGANPHPDDKLWIMKLVEYNKDIADAIRALTGDESMFIYSVRGRFTTIAMDDEQGEALLQNLKPHLPLPESEAGYVGHIGSFLSREEAIQYARKIIAKDDKAKQKAWDEEEGELSVVDIPDGGWVGGVLNSKRNVRTLVTVTLVKVSEGERKDVASFKE